MQFAKHITTVLLSLFLALLAQPADAQRRDRERERDREPERPLNEKEELSKDFVGRLWYGGGFNIGFGGYNGFSSFNFGLSPMVGYKIVRPLSAGVRVAYDFNSLKQAGYKSISLHSVDMGAFVRCRAFLGLFFQGELSNEWYQDLDYFTGDVYKDSRVNQRLGAGWNFGEPGGVGTEISILYNFKIANDIDTYRNPMEYRFGLTWKF